MLLASCGGGTHRSASNKTVRVGSKNFTEALVIGEIYAQALERAGFTVVRHLNLGSVQICMAAL
ncbi:MAG: hypothetical protein M3R35_04970, partial [Candidatus Eremiobacteraeota bacterium]|nr:hypothetical protein [Candidatus Eremiobacteraeota bacterium]